MPAPAWSRSAGRAASARRAGASPATEATVGVLVLANFGSPEDLLLGGDPGRRARSASGSGPAEPAGSCIAVVATDAPLDGAQLERLARRAGLGLARTGSVAHDGSGEIFLAFSTVPAGVRGPRRRRRPGARPVLRRGGRGDRGGRAERALGGRRHDRPRGPSRAGAAAGAGPRAPAPARPAVTTTGRSGRCPRSARRRRCPRCTKPENAIRLRPISCGPLRVDHAQDRRADEAAGDDQRDRDAVDGVVDVAGRDRRCRGCGSAPRAGPGASARRCRASGRAARARREASSRTSLCIRSDIRCGENRSTISLRAYGFATSNTLKSG